MGSARILPVLIAVGVALAASCRGPTEVTVVMSTDVKCGDLRGTSVTIGHLGEIEQKAVTATSTVCADSGDLGSLVIVPSGSTGDEVAIKVVAGVGRDAESCVPPYGKGCIVARRSIHYLPHSELRIAVPLRAACDGVACSDTQTCVAGGCSTATIADSNACAGPGGCGESALSAPAPVDGGTPDANIADAGADADTGPPVGVYNDMNNAVHWSTFDTATPNANAGFNYGVLFDKRYVHFIPYGFDSVNTNVTSRYDTRGAFNDPASWSAFDTKTVNANAVGFNGATFDGRFVYYVPHLAAATYSGLVTRYDTQAPFTSTSSFTTFDLKALNPRADGFFGGQFDGRYVYFVPAFDPTDNSVVGRYDTQAPFNTAASWGVFDVSTVNALAKDFHGAVFDRRYLYLVPYNSGMFVRFDTQAPFGSAGSWLTFNAVGLNAKASGYVGGAFDGHYVYFVPYQNTAPQGLVLRYDPQAPFGTGTSWTVFDATSVNALAKGFRGAAFDGRFVYFVPSFDGVAAGHMIVRYDSTAAFADATSWSTFDLAAVPGYASSGFVGAVFDGRYIYLSPLNGSKAMRFEARTTFALPPDFTPASP